MKLKFKLKKINLKHKVFLLFSKFFKKELSELNKNNFNSCKEQEIEKSKVIFKEIKSLKELESKPIAKTFFSKIENVINFKNSDRFASGTSLHSTGEKSFFLFYKDALPKESSYSHLEEKKYIENSFNFYEGYYPNGNLLFKVDFSYENKENYTRILFFNEFKDLIRVIYIQRENLEDFFKNYYGISRDKDELNFIYYGYDFYPNGILKKKYSRKGNNYIFYYFEFYDDGILKKDYYYNEKGNLENVCIDYYRNGFQKKLSNFTNGVKMGLEKIYYFNGELSRLNFYMENEASLKLLKFNFAGYDDTEIRINSSTNNN